MVKSLRRLRSKVRSFFNWLMSQEGTSGQRARGLAVGVFSGCIPLFGFQMILGVALAAFVRGNIFLAAAATWISNPITYLPLYWLNFKVGNAFLGQGSDAFLLDQATWQLLVNQGWLFVIRLFLGSVVVGACLGLFIGLIAYVLFRYSRRGIHN